MKVESIPRRYQGGSELGPRRALVIGLPMCSCVSEYIGLKYSGECILTTLAQQIIDGKSANLVIIEWMIEQSSSFLRHSFC